MIDFFQLRKSIFLDEASSKQVHVRMDNLGKDQKKVGDILRKYEKNGSIEFDGETDKGATFTVKKPAAISSLNRELKPYYTSADLNELSIDTMKSYRQKAADDVAKNKKPEKRTKGAVRATSKIYKKELGNLHRKEETDVEEMSTLTKIKAKIARGVRGPSKKATPNMFRQTGKAGKKNQDRLQKAKTYELGRRARQK